MVEKRLDNSRSESEEGAKHTRDLDDLQPPLVGNAEIAQGHLNEGLLFSLHNVGQAGVAGLVEAEVGGDDHREGGADGSDAAVDLLRNPRYAVPLLINLSGSVWFFLLIGQAGTFMINLSLLFASNLTLLFFLSSARTLPFRYLEGRWIRIGR